MGVNGAAPDTVAQLLSTAGGRPERLRSEAHFAALTGASPIQAFSEKTNRHRLNRGGDRQANSALYHSVIVRMLYDQTTKEYVTRRTAEGRTKAEILQCLKRYLARQLYPLIRVTLDSDRGC
ncbi:transposase [Kocuria rhizosphaericola]|uniref:transposase n=1 Tax=Kocuria rhizosphaericola TaxID=3376284 RepID=UPI003795B47F